LAWNDTFGDGHIPDDFSANDENSTVGNFSDEVSSDGIPPMIPYEPCSDDEDDIDYSTQDIPPFTDDGWDDECLQDDPEDIDFEFVYALHTFVATVEGQANATKGDTMVLLDDSNSYWWLVRIVKDSSIGKSIPGLINSVSRC
jgi:hypothetical protein